MNRVVVAHTVAGEVLKFKSMQGREALSCLYDFEVELLSERQEPVDIRSLLGTALSLEIETADRSKRYLSGDVTKVSLLGQLESSGVRYNRYKVNVRPWLWYLSRNRDCKIYQHMTVVDILDEVLGSYHGFKYEKKLLENYRQREFCVQYEESDFDFISRLMEHEGIFYYFRHEQGSHTLILCDDASILEALPGYETINYYPNNPNVLADKEAIDHWNIAEELQGVEYVVDDYDFKKSGVSLQNKRRASYSVSQANREIYNWQAGYDDVEQGEHYVKVRLEEARSQVERIDGASNVRGLAPGYTFSLSNSLRKEDDKRYLLIAVDYHLVEAGYASDNGDKGLYRFGFVVQDANVPFRALSLTPLPKTSGPQTAVITGPGGSEVYTDEYQRVKVHFRWDRYNQPDENSSCWIRVSNDSAGSGFGSVIPPRIGQEVIVDFIGGNPDRPVVVGRVYNDRQMPAFTPSPTQSGFVSRSFGGGSASNANHLIFDDAAGSELVHLHSEKDSQTSTENCHLQTVGVDHKHTVGNNHDIEVGNNLRTIIEAMEERLVKAEQKIRVNSNAIHNYDTNFDQTIGGIETRITEAEQNIKVNSDAIHNYDTNFDQTIGGIETRITEAEQSITVNSTAIHEYGSDLTQHIQANQNTTVNGNKTEEVKLWQNKTVGIGRNTFVGALDLFETVGTKLTIAPLNIGVYGVTASAFISKMDVGVDDYKVLGNDKKITGFKNSIKGIGQDIALSSSYVGGRVQKVAGVVQNVAGLLRKTKGVETEQAAIKQETVAVKNSVGGLDNSAKGLTNKV